MSLECERQFDDDGTIVQYDWDMDNDGIFENLNAGFTTFVTYVNEGTFTVRVRVTDDDGLTDIAVNSVLVQDPPA